MTGADDRLRNDPEPRPPRFDFTVLRWTLAIVLLYATGRLLFTSVG